jgi:hypothetical protein
VGITMAKAEIMLLMLKKHLDKIDRDTILFDENENLQAGMRIRSRLRKLQKMTSLMIKDTLDTSKGIKEKRGYKPYSYYYNKYKENGSWDKYAKKDKTKKLQDP